MLIQIKLKKFCWNFVKMLTIFLFLHATKPFFYFNYKFCLKQLKCTQQNTLCCFNQLLSLGIVVVHFIKTWMSNFPTLFWHWTNDLELATTIILPKLLFAHGGMHTHDIWSTLPNSCFIFAKKKMYVGPSLFTHFLFVCFNLID